MSDRANLAGARMPIMMGVLALAGCTQPVPQKLSIGSVPWCRGCLPAYPAPSLDERTLANSELCQAEPPSMGCMPPLAPVAEERQADHALCQPRPEGMRQIDDLKGALEVVIQTWDQDGLGALDMPKAVDYARKMLRRADWDQRPDL
jgi:hypothetical protein